MQPQGQTADHNCADTCADAVSGGNTAHWTGSVPMFGDLDSTGRFHRDTRCGTLFHPGKVSFRELAEVDSLHVCIGPDNRISVHVDSVSPVVRSAAGGSRYSPARVAAHNVAYLAALARRLFSRRSGHGHHRCELICERIEVGDDLAP